MKKRTSARLIGRLEKDETNEETNEMRKIEDEEVENNGSRKY